MAKLFIVILLFLLPFSGFSQCGLIPVTLEERCFSSDLIIEGRVLEQNSYYENGRIYTNNKIEIYKILKGHTDNTYISIRTEGGIVGNMAEYASNLLSLNISDYGIFTCVTLTQKPAVYDVYASAQGFIRFSSDYISASDVFNQYSNIVTALYGSIALHTKRAPIILKDTPSVIQQKATAATITSLSPKIIAAGMEEVLTINGTGFGNTRGSSALLFLNADDGGKTTISPSNSQYLSWSDTEIRIEVPYRAASGSVGLFINGIHSQSAESITIPYSQINIDPTNPSRAKHADVSGIGGYLWTMNNSFKDSIPARIALEKQFTKWRCTSGVNWLMASSTTTISSSSEKRDGINIITYNSTLPKGVLGICRSYYSGCSDNTFFVSELDISFTHETSAIKWHYDENTPINGQYDFGTVILHELGHGMQLAHTSDSASLMYYALRKNQIKQNIDNNTVEASSRILQYDLSGASCGPNTISAIDNSVSCTNLYVVPSFSKIKPNPCADNATLFFSIESSGTIGIELYDFTGALQYASMNEYLNAGVYEVPLNMKANANGLYLCRIIKDDKVIAVEKLIKQ